MRDRIESMSEHPKRKATAKKPLGKSNNILSFRIGPITTKVRLGPDGKIAPGEMIECVPGVLGFARRQRVR
jgi:hypothetical protein